MTVTVDAVVYFNVVTAELALCSVDDYRWDEILFKISFKSHSYSFLGNYMLQKQSFRLVKQSRVVAKSPITFP